MDFARKQLEKYGWTEGKGLGKHENGISQALKPKLKRSVTGIGHDAAAEFTEHWWTKLYNTAASNVEVKEKNGKTKKIKSKDDDFQISNSSWSYKKNNKSKSKEEYNDFFVRTSILTNGGVKTEDLQPNNVEQDNSIEAIKLTDEELFAACEGRTAHKGARHGLKALGKLARIEMQEQMLLQQKKYNGYSTMKKPKLENNVEDTSLVNNSSNEDKRKKKKKKHYCLTDAEVSEFTENVEYMKIKQTNITEDNIDSGDRKIKKKKTPSNTQHTEINIENHTQEIKKKKRKKPQAEAYSLFDSDTNNIVDVQKSSIKCDDSNIVTGQKRKNIDVYEIDISDNNIKHKKSKKKGK